MADAKRVTFVMLAGVTISTGEVARGWKNMKKAGVFLELSVMTCNLASERALVVDDKLIRLSLLPVLGLVRNTRAPVRLFLLRFCMTLSRFVTKNAFRNKRRSILTVLSIAFSLLLLTLMMTIWRAFYLDEGSAESAERLVVRHRVSLTFSLPGFYREKIRAVPGVVAVVPVSWFGGIYKDQKPENFFRAVRHRPRRVFQGIPRYSNAR
jgi:hypothetical protein